MIKEEKNLFQTRLKCKCMPHIYRRNKLTLNKIKFVYTNKQHICVLLKSQKQKFYGITVSLFKLMNVSE